MKHSRHIISRTALVLCVCVLLATAAFGDAAPTDAEAAYTFCAQEFCAGLDGELQGIYLSSVPDSSICLLKLGTRVVRSGDVLPFGDLDRLTLEPATENGGVAELTYLPICNGRVAQKATYTMSVKATRDQAPVAQDSELSTYKNIANTGKLNVTDAEQGRMTYAVGERPKQGKVELLEDGTFVYTPTRNKVGEDSFTYTATDEAGNVSEPATVRIKILQPLDEATFADLAPNAQFDALWMRTNGLFGGEMLAEKLCFVPGRSVTRGEYLTMCMKLAGIDPEIGLLTSGFSDQADAPTWMQPYLVSAMRRGIVQGASSADGLLFRPLDNVTRAEAVQMAEKTFKLEAGVLSEQSVTTMADAEQADMPLTRADAAQLLQQVWQAAEQQE